MNIIFPFLLKTQRFQIYREGLDPIFIEDPIKNGEKIFDIIVSSLDSHNLKSISREQSWETEIILDINGHYRPVDSARDIITISFVNFEDDEYIALSDDLIEDIAKWLGVIPPETIE